MERDHGARFTDEQYATKDEVKKTLNISSIDSIWDKICLYRSYYIKQVSLRSIERVPFSICYFNRLNITLTRLEKKLSKTLVLFSKLRYESNELSLRFEIDQLKMCALSIIENFGINVQQETLDAIIEDRYNNPSVETLNLYRYIKTLKHFEHRYNGPLSSQLLVSIYCQLRGLELDVTNIDSYFRKVELFDRAEHFTLGRHYSAAPVSKISELMNDLFSFNNSNNTYSIVNAIVSVFMIMYVKPFEDFNEEVALVYAKMVLAHFDNNEIGSLLPLEKFITSTQQIRIKKVMLESEMKNDLTYMIDYILPYVEEMIDEMIQKLESVDTSEIIHERYNTQPVNIVNENKPVERIIENSESNINFERKVSLPTMPVGLDDNDVILVANHLLELYPTLKKGQAEFYARHCTLGKYYTISQYKKELNCAYETARTSMDNLELLGFYKKECIRNKFVYTPVIRD